MSTFFRRLFDTRAPAARDHDEGRGKVEPLDFWPAFWATQCAATGKTREELLSDLERLLGRRPHGDELEAAIRRVFVRTK